VEDLLLFVLSSSFCTLATGVALLILVLLWLASFHEAKNPARLHPVESADDLVSIQNSQ
jgi:hypothetical protein